MKIRKLVLLKGKIATGKTTALHTLRKCKEMKNWVIIDFSALKHQFAHLGNEKRREYGKKSLYAILKILMEEKLNILLDEMSEKTLKENINYYIKKYNYQIITFEFTAKFKTSVKRETQRRIKRGLKPRGEHWVKDAHEMLLERFDKKGIIVDCDKLNKKQVVEFIINKLK